MTWMVSNVICRINDGDMWYPRKERHDAKIDGPVSAMICLAAHLADPVAQSAYSGTEIVI
jgi:phage terminase large subunit-like protein